MDHAHHALPVIAQASHPLHPFPPPRAWAGGGAAARPDGAMLTELLDREDAAKSSLEALQLEVARLEASTRGVGWRQAQRALGQRLEEAEAELESVRTALATPPAPTPIDAHLEVRERERERGRE